VGSIVEKIDSRWPFVPAEHFKTCWRLFILHVAFVIVFVGLIIFAPLNVSQRFLRVRLCIWAPYLTGSVVSGFGFSAWTSSSVAMKQQIGS
jgi:hypothetical protein